LVPEYENRADFDFTLQRPDLNAPIIDVKILREDLAEKGYIFIAPYRNVDPGPYIYDNRGELVWSGPGWSGSRVAHTPRVCQYHGEDHLCFFTGEQRQGFSRGHGIIMDKHYRTVQTVEAYGAGASTDMHEFKITPYSDGKSALMTVYQPRQYDLTTNPKYNVKGGMGWIVEGIFQEIEIDTGKLLFEWRSLDHIDPGDSLTMPHTTDTSGDGLYIRTPWDYFHLNSIDKNVHGDYLISARHVSCIYKLSGKDGSVIWRLGGVNSDFEMTNFNFAYQHHARWLSETKEKTIISFFDNASNAFNFTNEFSHGYIVEINHVTKKAKYTRKWGAPDIERGGLRAGSQGAMQLLPNGNVHIGWGEWAWYSEQTWDGKPVMWARIASRSSDTMCYRTNKYNWTAEPLTKPAIWTFSKFGEESPEKKMVFFVSWNGATEVASWDFYVSDSASGPWELVGNEPRHGFETKHHSKAYGQWSYAKALDVEGRPLGDSVIARTFVPSETLREFCSDEWCGGGYCGDEWCADSQWINNEDEAHTKLTAAVDIDQTTLSTNRGFDTTSYYHGEDFAGLNGVDSGPKLEKVDSLTPSEPSDDEDDLPVEDASTSLRNKNEYHFPAAGPSFDANSRWSYGNSSFLILIVGMVTGYIASVCMGFVRTRGLHRRVYSRTDILS
jgi:hypothetical protein